MWFSTNEEKGREMVVLSSRLRAGSREWEKPRMFYQIADRNLTGTALLNDHQRDSLSYQWRGGRHWQNLMMTLRTSTDNGQTWSKPRMIAPEHTETPSSDSRNLYYKGRLVCSRLVMRTRLEETGLLFISVRIREKLGRTRGMERRLPDFLKREQVPLSLESMPEW